MRTTRSAGARGKPNINEEEVGGTKVAYDVEPPREDLVIPSDVYIQIRRGRKSSREGRTFRVSASFIAGGESRLHQPCFSSVPIVMESFAEHQQGGGGEKKEKAGRHACFFGRTACSVLSLPSPRFSSYSPLNAAHRNSWYCFMAGIPTDLWRLVFLYLEDKAAVRATCRAFRALNPPSAVHWLTAVAAPVGDPFFGGVRLVCSDEWPGQSYSVLHSDLDRVFAAMTALEHLELPELGTPLIQSSSNWELPETVTRLHQLRTLHCSAWRRRCRSCARCRRWRRCTSASTTSPWMPAMTTMNREPSGRGWRRGPRSLCPPCR